MRFVGRWQRWLVLVGLGLSFGACGETGAHEMDAAAPSGAHEAGAGDGSNAGMGGSIAGSSAPDAAVPGDDLLMIETPLDRWAWLPIEGARCANGSSTGIGINRSAHSADLVIMLQGGGACWDATTCFVLNSAVNVHTGVDEARFQEDFVAVAGATVRDANNPISLATTAFIPYCTGDLHGGDAVRDYPGAPRAMHHVGARNVELALDRLQVGLPASPPHVWIIGSSAGGYGAVLNLEAISMRFPYAEVHMLGDCSPLVTPIEPRWQTWQTNWNLRLPPNCDDCATRFGALIDVLATARPTRRIALLAYARDATVAAFFGHSEAALETLLEAHLAESFQHPNTRYFLLPGEDHVMIHRLDSLVAPDGTQLIDWAAQWMLGLPDWSHAR